MGADRSRPWVRWLIGVLSMLAVLLWFFLRQRSDPESERRPGNEQETSSPAVESRRNGKALASASVAAHRRSRPLLLPVADRQPVPADAGGSLAGRVVSWTTGAGVPGADLTFSQGQGSFSCQSDGQGDFLFRAPQPGVYKLAVVEAKGYLPYAPAWEHSPIQLAAHEGMRVQGVRITLFPAVTYEGRVIDPDARPVAGAQIEMHVDVARHPTLVPMAEKFESGADGTFEFHAPDDALLIARHPDFAPAFGRVDVDVQVTHRITLRLGPGKGEGDQVLTISGRVIDQAGSPVPEALVGGRRLADEESDPGRGSDLWSAICDAEGRFDLIGLQPGRYELVASFEDHLPAVERSVVAGAADVVLRLGPVAGCLAGTVRERDSDAPVPGFSLLVSRTAGPLVEHFVRELSVFDAQGEFGLCGLEPGAYRVRAVAQGFAPSSPVAVEVPDSDEPVLAHLVLSVGGTVFGQVSDARSEQPIDGARVSMEGRLGTGVSAVPVVASVASDRAGLFELNGLPAGPLALTASAQGYHHRVSPSLQVVEGERTGPVTLKLTRLEQGEKPSYELAGIGAVLQAEGDAMRILRVLPGSGAEEAGLTGADAIVQVEGEPVIDLGFEGTILKIRGPEGTAVTLSVRRAGGAVVQVSVVRRAIRG